MNLYAPKLSAVVFSSRESIPQLKRTLGALRAALGETAVVDLVINGDRTLADQLHDEMVRNPWVLRHTRLWYSKLADKAHAWNEHLHHIWDGESWVFNVDGYVSVDATGPKLLVEALVREPKLLAATGTPTMGRSSKGLREVMLREGGLHGNFFLLPCSTMERLKDSRVRLPMGLYRTDATLGAMLSFRLNPKDEAWSPKHCIHVHPDVTWSTPERAWWRPSEWMSSLRRRRRQKQGRFENLATRHHFAVMKRSPGSLPSTISELVEQWARERPREFRSAAVRHPIAYLRLRSMIANVSRHPVASSVELLHSS